MAFLFSDSAEFILLEKSDGNAIKKLHIFNQLTYEVKK